MWNLNVGLGKTTLAHVAAQHCGYQPYEINASDDRTAASLVARIQVQWVLTYYMQHTGVYTVYTTAPATCLVAIPTSTLVLAALQDAAQMQSVMGSRKPNCIIVDEVDGTAGDRCTKHRPSDPARPSVSYSASRQPASVVRRAVHTPRWQRLEECCTGAAQAGIRWGRCGNFIADAQGS